MDDPQREFAKGPRLHQSDRIRRAVLVTMAGVSLAWLGGAPHAEEAPFLGKSGQLSVTGSDAGGVGTRDGATIGLGSRGDRGAPVEGGRVEGGRGEGGQNLGVGGPGSGDVAGMEASRVASAGEVIGFSHVDASGSQRITLVNTGKSWMAVYHIDRMGTIRLVSSRPIDADFSLQLNATSPLPEEIRQMAGPSR